MFDIYQDREVFGAAEKASLRFPSRPLVPRLHRGTSAQSFLDYRHHQPRLFNQLFLVSN